MQFLVIDRIISKFLTILHNHSLQKETSTLKKVNDNSTKNLIETFPPFANFIVNKENLQRDVQREIQKLDHSPKEEGKTKREKKVATSLSRINAFFFFLLPSPPSLEEFRGVGGLFLGLAMRSLKSWAWRWWWLRRWGWREGRWRFDAEGCITRSEHRAGRALTLRGVTFLTLCFSPPSR